MGAKSNTLFGEPVNHIIFGKPIKSTTTQGVVLGSREIENICEGKFLRLAVMAFFADPFHPPANPEPGGRGAWTKNQSITKKKKTPGMGWPVSE